MKVDTEIMENQMVASFYEQPSLKKYGTMKEFTLGSSGSGGDGMGVSANPTDPTVNFPDVGGAYVADGFFGDGNTDKFLSPGGANRTSDNPVVVIDAGADT
ncbi:MAG: hypothetical protein F6K16_28830 [Symploca sp. SIO2B6]|nr:hypothetical protein [Symploca sp. SIO2B6]